MKKPISLLLGLSLLGAAWAKEMTPAHHGYEQGKQAGIREGRDRVGDRAYRDGDIDGYSAGLAQGQQQLLDSAFAQGLSQGANDGTAHGRQEGRDSGLEQGRQDGQAQGELKAREAADKAAATAVAARAQADGTARAHASNPKADGVRLGHQAGIQRAQKEAQEKDFTRARQDYRAKQYSSAPKIRSDVRQAPLTLESGGWLLARNAEAVFGRPSCPGPDWRYLRYGSDNEEYQSAYRRGYSEGVRQGFDDGYDREYRYGYDRAFSLGLSNAVVGNLQATVDQAYEEGFAKAHKEAFEQANKAAHQEAYTPAFEAAYTQTYSSAYPQFEAQHYKTQEDTAFQAIYDPPYQEAFSVQETATFTERYPKEAKRAYDTGWKAEAQDFARRPVRLLEAWVSPTEVEGLGLLCVRLRNFSDQTVVGKRLRVSFGSSTSRFYHPIPAHSEMTVTGLLRMRGDIPGGSEIFGAIESDGKTYPLDQVVLGPPPTAGN